MRLSSRFILDNLFLLAAAFLVVGSRTWSAGVAGWLAFGVSAGITVIAGTSAVLTDSRARKLGHGLIALVALADLTAHEATTEKVVHQLVVHDGTAAPQRAAA